MKVYETKLKQKTAPAMLNNWSDVQPLFPEKELDRKNHGIR